MTAFYVHTDRIVKTAVDNAASHQSGLCQEMFDILMTGSDNQMVALSKLRVLPTGLVLEGGTCAVVHAWEGGLDPATLEEVLDCRAAGAGAER